MEKNLHDRTTRIIRWIESQGAAICWDPHEAQRLVNFVSPVVAVFPELVKRLSAVYVYRMRDQSGDAAGCDGICWKHGTPDCGTLFALGISVEGMDRGREYVAFLFMHELAHTARITHDSRFHEFLNSLIGRYNLAYGANLSNDFFDLPMRIDSRSYDPFAGSIQQESSRKGTTFRTSGKAVDGR